MRRRLMLAGIVPSLLLLVFAAGAIRMSEQHQDGLDAFDAERYATAAEEFAGAGAINPFEDWVSAFDEGTAWHAREEFTEAIDLYRLALESVPDDEECTVRINLALAHEGVGDAAAAQAPDNALEAWKAGLRVLREGGCPTDAGRGERQTEDAAAVEERLQEKIRGQSQDQEPDGDPEDGRKQRREERREQREESRRQRELEERNDRGRERRERERRDDEGGATPQW